MEMILERLNWRYAVKKFDPTKKLSSHELETLLEALRLTASSFGLQLWKFLVVENHELRLQLLEQSYKQRQVVDASHMIILCAVKEPQESDVDSYIKTQALVRNQQIEDLSGFKKVVMDFMNRKTEDSKRVWLDNQLYIALGNLLTTCAVMNIDACPMEGFSKVGYRKVLDLDARGLVPVVACPVGFRALDDKYATMNKVRFNRDEIVEFL